MIDEEIGTKLASLVLGKDEPWSGTSGSPDLTKQSTEAPETILHGPARGDSVAAPHSSVMVVH